MAARTVVVAILATVFVLGTIGLFAWLGTATRQARTPILLDDVSSLLL
jgi:hypothetical protein